MKSLKLTFAVLAACAVSIVQLHVVIAASPAHSKPNAAAQANKSAVKLVHAPYLTTVTQMKMDMAAMHTGDASRDAELQAKVGQGSMTTTYLSGRKMRVENLAITIILDMDAGKMWKLNPATRTYSVTNLGPEQIKAMMNNLTKSPAAGGDGMSYKVKDTGRTRMILGHTARHYIVTMKMTMMGSPMDVTEDVLAAEDLAGPDFGHVGGKYPIKGLPLVTTMKMTGGPMGAMTMTMTVTSISTDPIPESEFKVPSDYTQTAAPANGGFAGMMPH